MIPHGLIKNWIILKALMTLGIMLCSAVGNDDSTSCNKQRQILTSTWGIITDGDKEYPMDSHCEWLIKANSSSQYILLRFQEMDTECSYDHIFIYDGDSYDSPLLGSFSGSTLPTPVIARSGSMLILLYSDTNYVLKGFRAEFQVTDCPLNCSGRGTCRNHRCVCHQLWTGEKCDINLCPSDCGESEGRGRCEFMADPQHCRCNAGYSGQACSLPASNELLGNTWHVVAQQGSGMSPRAGHAGVYLHSTDRFYVFGGYAFGKVLGDLLTYDFNLSRWINLRSKMDFVPSPRWSHAMTSYGNYLVLYGGQLEDGTLSDELWLYNVAKHEWHLEANRSIIRPPALAKHSLTQVERHWLYLFGGTVQDGAFSSAMYRINLHDGAEWEKVIPVGGKELDRRLAGHTAVYHSPMKSLLVYGGLSVDYSRFSKLSDQLHAFHVEKRYWTRLHFSGTRTAEDKGQAPLERAFHSSAIIGDYMVVYGGYMHKHSVEEVCYDNTIYLYHLKCHKWVSFQRLRKGLPGSSSPVRQGVFSHAMAIRHGHTILIAGGYSGTLRGDLLAYVMPPVVTAQEEQSSSFFCMSHRNKEGCLANPLCGWCVRSSQEYCLEKSRASECEKSYFLTEPCPGLCPSLPDCHSCLVWGESSFANVIRATTERSVPLMCGWCVQGVQCHAIGEVPEKCWLFRNTSRSDPVGWWGPHGTDITSLEKCQTQNFRPGLTLLKYRHPPNWEQPDEVRFSNQTTEVVGFMHEFSGEREGQVNGENVARFRGFIYPSFAQPLSEKHVRMFMGSSGVQAVLRISTDETEKNLEVVANHTSSTYMRTEALRPNNRTLFDITSPNQKYLIDFMVRQPVKSPNYSEKTIMQIVWNAYPIHNEVPDLRYLEPYKNGSCHTRDNCLSCLSDVACGWCDPQSQCFPRQSRASVCQSNKERHFLITWPEGCPVCSDYIYCEDCAKISHCEWLVEEAHCVRRGRFEDAVRHPDLCPTPCHLRSNCTSCLGDPGRCAWCEQTQTCFLFSTYTTSFMYGGCREWVDEDHQAPSGLRLAGAQCRDCSRHVECKTCLKDLLCGWCGNKYYPMIGVCTDGDFSGPYSGDCDSLVPEARFNSSVPVEGSTVWSYGTCPDLEECLLGIHNCHVNATCINTPQSYNCTCNRGFKGDGFETCEQTCSEDCVHGYCSEAPDFRCICELGWTGPDCSVNCGCNNHSTCVNGVGMCDRCEDWTEGEFCELCRVGSYGNATTSFGCQKCNCNGHGNISAGLCDRVTGTCFCEDNTEGKNCERCKTGYYGDPRSGGRCFRECSSRGIITNIQSGGLGSQIGSSSVAHCLWILTVHSSLDSESLSQTNCGKFGPCKAIMLTIHTDMKIPCPSNHVYVYDSLPEYITSRRLKKPLGSFCGHNLTKPVTLVGTSGFLTVIFDRSSPNFGFNATYQKLECPSHCKAFARVCTDGRCICKKGHSGQNCEVLVCPNECSASDAQGVCDQVSGRCLCMTGFGGEDCSRPIKSTHLVWTTLFDPRAASPRLSSLSAALPRMGHSLLASEGDLWIFGGYSTIRGDLNDIMVFNLATNRWEEVTPSSDQEIPEGRHGHGAAIADSDIYVYGGLRGNTILGDFWVFKTRERTWKKRSSSGVPALAGHTLTAIDNIRLVLIGGFSSEYGFLEKSFQYSVRSDRWSELNTTGASPIGIYGHTTVHYPPTSSLYIYGGYLYKVDHAMVSGELYAFHYTSLQWFRLPPDEHINAHTMWPLPRYFHAAVTIDDHMLIIGGRSNNSGEIIRQISAYTYKCNRWLNIENDDIRTIGTPPDEALGLAAAVLEGQIYIFGGFSGRTSGRLTRLSLPRDLCHLFSHSRIRCLMHMGCSYCSAYDKGINKTYCYSQGGPYPPGCIENSERNEKVPGLSCTAELIERRNCYQYKSCVDCVTAWPSHLQAKQVCQWCSNCQQGRCIPAGGSCEKANECSLPQRVVNMPSLCPLRLCLASDCDKCKELGQCMWTRQVLRSYEWGHTLNMKPIFDWVCVRKIVQDAAFPMESMPPLQCPSRCHQHQNCTSCLESNGGEGGWHKCYWSETLQECMPPSYEPLVCEGGACGLVLHKSPAQCAVPCAKLIQASQCLTMPHCGWCAFQGSRVDGRGLCMGGGILGPREGQCDYNYFLYASKLSANVTQWLKMSNGSTMWAYLEQPPENECLNGHHTCDERHEECVDTPTGFKCKCKQGYVLEGKECKPVCSQGCVFGTCVEPDVCECHFGYVGPNCSIQCECNGHSMCGGANALKLCLDCQNNTQGSQCQKCKPLFVGNPVNGGRCVPCRVYCSGHSDVCLSQELFNSSMALVNDQVALSNLAEMMKEGPVSDAVCLNCQNNTEGARCDQCIAGFFKAGESMKDGCRPCACHGHGDMCNPSNGENCNCQNNTENDRQCSQKNNKNMHCWQFQCSKCKEYFLGAPTDGHQCYRHMFLDKDYCFDPNTQDECNRKPGPLLQGRTVFFAVQPRYMNVDIRIVVDVSHGGVDFFFSAKDDTFVVDVNKTSGVHIVSVDGKYFIDNNNNEASFVRPKRRKNFSKRDTWNDVGSDTYNDSASPLALKLHQVEAIGLTTFVTISDSREFLLVRNLENRLVITIPQEVHDLRTTRFYMVLRGVGSESSDVTFGSLFFRQDQSRIDLFVFFSVFFSCFFLFLAVCVVAWKIKQAFDVRRARRLHAAEMKNMASRPFGIVQAIIDSEVDEFEVMPYSPVNYRKKVKSAKGLAIRESPKIHGDDRFTIRPVAIEPTSDGIAAVATVLVQLPGGCCAPVRMSLGSSLITVRGMLPHGNGGFRVAMRRRASHATL